jgi:hypothetical protein
VGYSRNPENDTSGREQQPPFNAFPATIIYSETAANTYTAIGNLSDGLPLVPILDLTVGHLTPVAGLTTYPQNAQFERGKISSWNVSMQQLLPYNHSFTLGYVANRQDGLTRGVNQNYGQLGGGTPSQPYASTTTSAINIQSPAGKVKYDSLQASVAKRMSHGLQYSFAYTYAQSINWWAGTIPAAAVLVPEQGGDGAAAHAQHLGGLRAAVWRGAEIPGHRPHGTRTGRMAGEHIHHCALGQRVRRQCQRCVTERGHRDPPASRSSQGQSGDLRRRHARPADRILRCDGFQAGH